MFYVAALHDYRSHIPERVTAVHLLALGWTVFTAHYTALYVGGLLMFPNLT